MRFQDWLSGRQAAEVGLWIGRHTPRWLGHTIARLVADVICWRQAASYGTVRDNLAQVLGPGTDAEALHRMVRHVFRHAGETYYDFFRRATRGSSAALASAIRFSPDVIDFVNAETAAGRGVLLLGIHMSNFDLGIVALCASHFEAQILSAGEEGDGFALLNEVRALSGLNITPITPRSLRAAIRKLKGGGIVVTGADRPTPADGPLVPFFGRPSRLPLGPARLAVMTGATVLLGACYHDPQEGYILDMTYPIEMAHSGDRHADTFESACRLARVMEGYIRAHPEQWLMFYPVWGPPEACEEQGAAT